MCSFPSWLTQHRGVLDLDQPIGLGHLQLVQGPPGRFLIVESRDY